MSGFDAPSFAIPVKVTGVAVPPATIVSSVGLSAPDIFNVSGSPVTSTGTLAFTPTDPNADKIVFWDDSAGKWVYLTVGTGLDITGTTLTSTITQYTDEMARDALGTALVAGTGISITVNDGADTITVASTASDTGWKVITTGTCSAQATLDLVNGSSGVILDSTYKIYRLYLKNFIPVNNAAVLWNRVSENTGSTYKSGASDYSNNGVNGAQISFTGAMSNAASGISVDIFIHNPANTTLHKQWRYHGVYETSTGIAIINSGGGYKGSVNAIDAIRVMFDSGNIASGDWVLMGLKES